MENFKSDASLKRREAAVTAREDKATQNEQRLAALKTDVEGKANRIKNLAGEIA
jgi:hypothetical protein